MMLPQEDYVEVDLSEVAAKLKAMGVSPEDAQDILSEMGLRLDLQQYLRSVAAQAVDGKLTISMEEVHRELNEIARKKYGVEYGVPLPSSHDPERPLIMARGTPLATLGRDRETLFREELERQQIPVRNSWVRLRDTEVAIVETERGPYVWPRYLAGTRMRMMMETSMMRSGAQTAERELRAMESLKTRISERQWDSYVLNGIFPEHSKRSDLHYFFRKGLPTMVLSYHGDYEKGGHIITTLCLHPYGYYWGTMCGLMCPTDEVICALLMMRGDEHAFWKKSGQWKAYDVRSGL